MKRKVEMVSISTASDLAYSEIEYWYQYHVIRDLAFSRSANNFAHYKLWFLYWTWCV